MLVHHISLVVRQTWVKSVEPPAQQLLQCRPALHITTHLHAVDTCENNKICYTFLERKKKSRLKR